MVLNAQTHLLSQRRKQQSLCVNGGISLSEAPPDLDLTPHPRENTLFSSSPRGPLVMPRPLPVNPGNPSSSSEGRSVSRGEGKSVLVAETASAELTLRSAAL